MKHGLNFSNDYLNNTAKNHIMELFHIIIQTYRRVLHFSGYGDRQHTKFVDRLSIFMEVDLQQALAHLLQLLKIQHSPGR